MRTSVAPTLPLFPPDPAPPVVAAPPRVLRLEELVERVNAYAEGTRAEATRRAYLADFRSFEAWCARHGLVALPAAPATVSVYLVALAEQGRRVSTLERAPA